MLNHPTPSLQRQQGVVLMIALIMLVAMTMGGIALIRSVYTSSLIAGNMAFQQSATVSGDAGIEAAVTWLELNSSGKTLHQNSFENGYAASRLDPGSTQNWNQFWAVLDAAGQVVTLASADAAGNTVKYAIQRLCNAVGDPASGAGCAIEPGAAVSSGNSRGVGIVPIKSNGAVYYRITARVSGPRGTLSYVQAVVAL